MPSQTIRRAPVSRAAFLAALIGVMGLSPATFAQRAGSPVDQDGRVLQDEYIGPSDWVPAFRDGVRRGRIPGGAGRLARIGPVAPGSPTRGSAGCVTPAQIFPFEDSAGLLLTNFSTNDLITLMADAAGALLAANGDNYDFIGYWLNFDPHHTIGAAFYLGIFNDVSGIGDPSGGGFPLFDFRAELGLPTNRIQGWVMMWNVNSGFWQAGDGSGADFTRLALGQEFEHRFAMFLPNLLDGRLLQGDNGSCGRGAHWNWRVDGQGSSMEISNWVGSSPAVLSQSFVTFNTDIPGSVFSYTDLYLMGYVFPAEMDAGNSELRYMNNSSCAATYSGPISDFSSADIIAAAGTRVPDSSASQKNFRTAWIMFHRPGDSPSAAELNKAAGILTQHQTDWELSTLGRGVMDDTLFDDCNCNGVPDADDIASGTSSDVNGDGIPDECACPADIDGDGDADIDDFFAFVTAFAAGDPAADINGDGTIDVGDFFAFVTAFSVGCV